MARTSVRSYLGRQLFLRSESIFLSPTDTFNLMACTMEIRDDGFEENLFIDVDSRTVHFSLTLHSRILFLNLFPFFRLNAGRSLRKKFSLVFSHILYFLWRWALDSTQTYQSHYESYFAQSYKEGGTRSELCHLRFKIVPEFCFIVNKQLRYQNAEVELKDETRGSHRNTIFISHQTKR